MRRLTHRQKSFPERVASGFTYTQAYREAYNSNGKSSTIRNEASRLMKNPKIASAVEEYSRSMSCGCLCSAWEQLKAAKKLGKMAGLI